jgi:hypothetical protein
MIPNKKRKTMTLKIGVSLIWAASVIGLGLQGCQSNADKSADGSAPTTQPKLLGIFPPAPDRTGVQLWADNCNRCHNAPPPERFSDAQWATIVHHMRLRANLTGEEQRKITEFLQASN